MLDFVTMTSTTMDSNLLLEYPTSSFEDDLYLFEMFANGPDLTYSSFQGVQPDTTGHEYDSTSTASRTNSFQSEYTIEPNLFLLGDGNISNSSKNYMLAPEGDDRLEALSTKISSHTRFEDWLHDLSGCRFTRRVST